MPYIVESIGSWGVKTSNMNTRIDIVRSGDVVAFPNKDYPFSKGGYGRVDTVGFLGDENLVHICCEMGSAFLCENGDVQISGGPFITVNKSDLIPTFETRIFPFWNWGDQGRGPGKGVDYCIARPVFKLVEKKDNNYL